MQGNSLALFLTVIAAALVPGLLIFLASVLGPKRMTPVKALPFECGMPPSGPARERFPVKFYLIGVLFLVFDVELVFFYPWAVLYDELAIFGFIEMMVFILIVALALIYAWKEEALEWR
ncbi:MAG: NADH-quinone oxidoreductase subunit A [Candidatus Brocadiales bacterium]